MTEMKLTYFKSRGRAETIRLLFHLAGKSFIDNRIDHEEWEKLKPSTPKGQLPILEVDGKVICESMAITRFVARETGLYGSDSWEAAICDMIADTTSTLFEAFVAKVFLAKTDEEKAEAQEKIDSIFEELESLAKSLKKKTFILGEKASLPDVLLYSVVEFGKIIDLDFEKKHSGTTVSAVAKSLASVPSIAEWLRIRPETPH